MGEKTGVKRNLLLRTFFRKFFRVRKAGLWLGMKNTKLVRELRLEALARLEDAARTEADFMEVVEQWDHLDQNRERRERDHEKQRDERTFEVGYKDGEVFPSG